MHVSFVSFGVSDDVLPTKPQIDENYKFSYIDHFIKFNQKIQFYFKIMESGPLSGRFIFENAKTPKPQLYDNNNFWY